MTEHKIKTKKMKIFFSSSFLTCSNMPRHLISDTHEWIQMVPTVAILLKREVMDGIVGWRVCSSSLLTTSLLQATSHNEEEGDDGEGDGG